MEFFESKRIEAYLMFREAGLTEEDLQDGERFFHELSISGCWTSFEEFQKHFYGAFALYKILESIFIGMNIKDIKRLILDSQAGVSITMMQEAPKIFSELNPLFIKLNEKYTKLNKVLKIISLEEESIIDPTSKSFINIELLFQKIEKVNEKEKQLAYIAITEIIEQIMNMIQPFQDRSFARVLSDLFKFVLKFNFFTIYSVLQGVPNKDQVAKLENQEYVSSLLEIDRMKSTVKILKEKIKSIDYDLKILERNYNEGLYSEKEYQIKKYRLYEQQKQMQQKIFDINLKLIKNMTDTI
ncbi:MAG: hypothetical protein ACTSVE_07070 [Candidatus Helarchaeota archaeon]